MTAVRLAHSVSLGVQPQDEIERASQAGVATLGWAITPDGKRFLFPIPVAADASNPPLQVVLNWTSLLKQ